MALSMLSFATAGPCGGVNTFGNNGVNEVVNGQEVSLKIAYNGGHQDAKNAFHVAMMCGSSTSKPGSETPLKVSGTDITTNQYTLTQINPMTIPATDSSQVGYTFTFKLPLQSNLAANEYCVISLMDQRNWGGCADFHINAAGSGSTTAGPAQSPCQSYCSTMQANCASTFTNTSACLQACSNYPTNGANGTCVMQCACCVCRNISKFDHLSLVVSAVCISVCTQMLRVATLCSAVPTTLSWLLATQVCTAHMLVLTVAVCVWLPAMLLLHLPLTVSCTALL